MNEIEKIEQLVDNLYDKIKDQRKITPLLVMKHAQVDFDTALRICEKIWRRLREDAQKWALEVIHHG